MKVTEADREKLGFSPKTKLRRPLKRKPKKQKPLPSPVEICTSAESHSAPNPEPSRSLFGNLLGNSQQVPVAEIGSPASLGGSGTEGPSLDAEAQRILNSIPDKVTEGEPGMEAADAGEGGPAVAVAMDAAQMGRLMDAVVFTPQMIESVIGGLCARMDQWLKVDVWELSPIDKAMIGEPYAQLFNGLWDRVKQLLPVWLSSTCEGIPGLVPSVLVTAIVFGPRGWETFLVRKARGAKPVTVNASVDAEASAPASNVESIGARPGDTGKGVVWAEGVR